MTKRRKVSRKKHGPRYSKRLAGLELGKYWDRKTGKVKSAFGYWMYIPGTNDKDYFVPVKRI